MLVSLGGAQTWPPEINENIWNLLLLFQRLLFSRELLYNHINFSPNAIFLSHLQPGGDIKSEDLAIYDFRIL